MRIRSPLGRLVSTLVGVGTVGLLWLCFAPSALGGSTNYVVTEGVSMQPRFHSGDLAIVRAQSSYHVGEIVAYRSVLLHTLVLHRIIGRDGSRYLFKGDNNDFVDQEHPTASQLVGKLWLQLPGAGNKLNWLRTPAHAAVGSGLAAMLVLGPGLGLRRRKRRPGEHPGQEPRAPASPMTFDAARILLTVGAFGLVAFGLLMLIGYRHEPTRTVDAPGAYSQQGTFEYSGRATPGTIYPTGTVRTGSTVFVRLARQLHVGFVYGFESKLRHRVFGTARLEATLSSATGWSTRIAGGKPQAFQGDRQVLTLSLDLGAAERTLQQYYALTGLNNDNFTISIAPSVQIRGELAGRPLSDSFVPRPLAFQLDSESLRPLQSPAPETPGEPAANPFHSTADGSVEQTVPRTATVLLAHPTVSGLRHFGSIGAVASLLAALAGAALLAATRRGGELARIQRTYGHAIVPVTSPPPPPHGHYVELQSFEHIAHLAEGYGRVVLHHDQAGAHAFYVNDESSVFRYRLEQPVEPVEPDAPPVVEDVEPRVEPADLRDPRKGLVGRLQLWTSRSAV
jgi:signal peptidase I